MAWHYTLRACIGRTSDISIFNVYTGITRKKSVNFVMIFNDGHIQFNVAIAHYHIPVCLCSLFTKPLVSAMCETKSVQSREKRKLTQVPSKRKEKQKQFLEVRTTKEATQTLILFKLLPILSTFPF